MSKLDKLRQASEGTFVDLYIDNKPKEMETPQPQPSKVDANVERKELRGKLNASKMLSFRLPLDLIDKLDKYRYVAREKKQDVIIKALDEFLDGEDAKKLIAEYDNLMK